MPSFVSTLSGLLAMLATATGARLRRDRLALDDARRHQAVQAERLRGLALMQAIEERDSAQAAVLMQAHFREGLDAAA